MSGAAAPLTAGPDTVRLCANFPSLLIWNVYVPGGRLVFDGVIEYSFSTTVNGVPDAADEELDAAEVDAAEVDAAEEDAAEEDAAEEDDDVPEPPQPAATMTTAVTAARRYPAARILI